MALRLAREGCHLYLLDIDLTGLAQTAHAAAEFGVEVVTARCDVGRPAEITSANRDLLARWGYLDILVNNAGVAYYGPTDEMTAQQWDWLLSINLLAPIQFVRELLPVLKNRPESHIVNVASMWGLVAMGRFTAYNVSKFGLVGFSESLRAEYGRQGVGVSTICPGFVSTNLFRSAPCGHASRKTPEPPRLMTTTPEYVAQKIMAAIRHDRRMVVITPVAHFLYALQRFAPSVLDFFQRLGRRRRIARKAHLQEASPPSPAFPALPLPANAASTEAPGPTLLPFCPRQEADQQPAQGKLSPPALGRRGLLHRKAGGRSVGRFRLGLDLLEALGAVPGGGRLHGSRTTLAALGAVVAFAFYGGFRACFLTRPGEVPCHGNLDQRAAEKLLDFYQVTIPADGGKRPKMGTKAPPHPPLKAACRSLPNPNLDSWLLWRPGQAVARLSWVSIDRRPAGNSD